MNIESVWLEYQSSLKAFLHKNIANHADVDDIMQEILIKTYTNLPKLNDVTKVKPWLFQIANHTIIDFYRRQAKTNAHLDIATIEVESFWLETDEESVIADLSDCITPFVNALNKDDQQLLTKIELQGLSQKQAAIDLGLNYSTLKSRVKRSRQNLLQLFDDCCHFSIDARGNLFEYEGKMNSCHKC